MKSEVKVGDNHLQITRVFDAPRHLVFAFWKEVDRLQQWLGLQGYNQGRLHNGLSRRRFVHLRDAD